MGCGKSTVGKTLARIKNIPFIDLDQYIEKQQNKSVAEIFSTGGELTFRKIEREALLHLIGEKSPAVIALGGGTPCYFDNMDKLIASPHASFYLNASIPLLASRLKAEKAQRPLIAHLENDEALIEFIGKHLFERNAFYRKAKHILDIYEETPAELADRINNLLG